MSMKGKYVIKRNNVLETFDHWDDIPLDFDHLIAFKPEFPELEPHTDEDHAELAKMNEKMTELMEIERARSNQNR